MLLNKRCFSGDRTSLIVEYVGPDLLALLEHPRSVSGDFDAQFVDMPRTSVSSHEIL